MSLIIDKSTLQKFDVQGPRYTSYPTAPVWQPDVQADVYQDKLTAFGKSRKTLSLYVHIPFCESMCTFCGCSVVIRPQKRSHSDEYLGYLIKELDLITRQIGRRKTIRQLHFGGGTPTFFRQDQIEFLFSEICKRFDMDFDGEMAIEIDPRTIDVPKLQVLKDLGFNRISLGIQDFDPRVQEAVNRVQPFALVKEYYDICRDLGFSSINFDLIYGLPYQTPDSFAHTLDQVLSLRPDRIALYSFAYVPWLKKHQNKMDQESLPSAETKIDIFMEARNHFLAHGYQAIAMDHFALKRDELAQAFNTNKLYRNFMGYTVKPADEYIGIGMSSIGFLEKTFIQNQKTLPAYYAALDGGRLPVERGRILSEDDQKRQYVIHELMCHFQIDKDHFQNKFGVPFDRYFQEDQAHMQKCLQDGLIEVKNNGITVTELGKLFVRNICMGFDVYLQEQLKNQHKFSRTV